MKRLVVVQGLIAATLITTVVGVFQPPRSVIGGLILAGAAIQLTVAGLLLRSWRRRRVQAEATR